jgi:hypothetical protein
MLSAFLSRLVPFPEVFRESSSRITSLRAARLYTFCIVQNLGYIVKAWSGLTKVRSAS